MVTVMRRRKTKKRWGVGEAMCWGGVKVKEVEGQGGEGSNKNKKGNKTKKLYKTFPSRSGLVKTFYVNRGVVGSKKFMQSTNHTLIKVMQE